MVGWVRECWRDAEEREERAANPPKVYVVMSNDFPDAVFDNQQAADEYIEMRKRADTHRRLQFGGPTIYWKRHDFDLRSSHAPAAS